MGHGDVRTGIGTLVDRRGGHVYPEKVPAAGKKPIRIFMIDGRNDNRGPSAQGGAYDPNRDWFLQNVRLMEALTKKVNAHTAPYWWPTRRAIRSVGSRLDPGVRAAQACPG